MDYVCKECQKSKDEQEFYFWQTTGYRKKVCKECVKKKPYNSNEYARRDYEKRKKKWATSCGTSKTKKCPGCKEEKHISAFTRAGSGRCKECHNAYMRAWTAKNPDKVSLQNKLYKKRHPEAYRNSELKHHYGITLNEYNELLEKQGGVCAICKNKERTVHNKNGSRKRMLGIDHCHKTGKVRGLLCKHCNQGLGNADDSMEVLKSMIKYLEEHNGRHSCG
jgi:hypothetical protein